MKKQILIKPIAVTITIALVVILLSQIKVGDLIGMMRGIKSIYLVAGLVLSATSYFLRALRFHVLFKGEIGLKALFSIVCVHNMALNILPARSGELSYIYLLTKRHSKSIGEGTATLLIVKILDIISISMLFLVTALLAHNLPSLMIRAVPIVGFFVFVIAMVLLLFIYHSNKFVTWFRAIFGYLKLNKRDFINYIFRIIDETVLSFNLIHRDQLIQSVLISACLWINLYAVEYTLINAMGINMTIEALLIASTFFFVISIVPIQGIGGFGTFEGSWAISFIAVGVAKEAAISSGFIVHIISFIYIVILFSIGFVGLSKK